MYLDLSTNITTNSVKQRLAANRIHFWTEVVPYLEQCSIQECPNCVQDSDVTSDAATFNHGLYIKLYIIIASIVSMMKLHRY